MKQHNCVEVALAISALSLLPGEHRTLDDLSCFARAAKEEGFTGGVTRQNFSIIEQRALRKCRRELMRRGWNAEVREAMDQWIRGNARKVQR